MPRSARSAYERGEDQVMAYLRAHARLDATIIGLS